MVVLPDEWHEEAGEGLVKRGWQGSIECQLRELTVDHPDYLNIIVLDVF